MKRYSLKSFMSLFLMMGISFVLSATDVKEKDKKTGCTGVAVEQTQNEPEKKPCCKKSAEDKTTKEAKCTGEVKTTSNTNGSGCAKKCGKDKTKSGSAPGECTKVPSGVGSQRTENR